MDNPLDTALGRYEAAINRLQKMAVALILKKFWLF